MRPEDQFHVGIVVDDFDATLANLSELFGYEWCDEFGTEMPVSFPTGESMTELRFVYSKAAPRLEIIRSVPGTLWPGRPSTTSATGRTTWRPTPPPSNGAATSGRRAAR
jgi:hypothetical protein